MECFEIFDNEFSNKTAIEMLKIINENSPISRKKISDKLGYSSRTGNIKRAMNLLIKNELINLTNSQALSLQRIISGNSQMIGQVKQPSGHYLNYRLFLPIPCGK